MENIRIIMSQCMERNINIVNEFPISIVCVYNNEEMLKKCLLWSLDRQSVRHQRILIDNTQGKYKSAAAALNYGASKATGETIAFIHQDVVIFDETFLENIVKALKHNPKQLIGVAGKIDNTIDVYSNITDGLLNCEDWIEDFKEVVGEQISFYNTINGYTEALTIDELFIAMDTSIFIKYYFDEKTCEDWHFYGVELCLRMRIDGIKTYIVPARIHHNSNGASMNSGGWHTTLLKVCEKYRKQYYHISSTTVLIPTGRLSSRFLIYLRLVVRNNKIAKKIWKRYKNFKISTRK